MPQSAMRKRVLANKHEITAAKYNMPIAVVHVLNTYDRLGCDNSLGRIRRAVHVVGEHKSVDGAETLGVGGLNIPEKKTSTVLTFTARESNKP